MSHSPPDDRPEMASPVSEPASDLPELPDSVQLIRLGGKEVYLVGTAHVSQKSVDEVARVIEAVRPDTVCVELCQARYVNLKRAREWKKTDVVKVVREGKALLLLASLIMSSFQRRIGDRLGVRPGAEMAEAIRLAEANDMRLELLDRDIQTTLKRAWRRLGWKDKLRMVFHLLGSLFIDEEVDERIIEELKQHQNIQDALQMLAVEFPALKETLVVERDVYMAQKLRQAEGGKIVAPVGAAHVAGIREAIFRDHPLEPLEALPQSAFFPKLLQWGIPVLIVGLLVYGFFTRGAEESIRSIWIWFAVNGSLSALGAALAWGHPLSVLSAFLAAPLTSLNPLMAAGWVSGLVQAFVKKPTVDDLEALPEAITNVKGFWSNPASRILLVVAFSNIGSVLGTFLAGSWIAARSLG